MNILSLSGLGLLLLLGSLRAAEETGCELHLIKIGEIPSAITLKTIPDGKIVKMEASPGLFRLATLMPKARRVSLSGEKMRGQMPLGEVDLPESGRHLLLVMSTLDAHVRTAVIPTDADHLPKGSLGFLNLTTRTLRCYLDDSYVEVAPGETKAHPSASTERRYVRHRLLTAEGDQWKSNGSTTLMLGTNRRYVMIVTEDAPNGPLRRELISDLTPDVNMAPLVHPASPVTTEPPLPGQPAK